MLGKIKKHIQIFINSKKDTPVLVAIICALTPLLFYYSNNYWAVNSWPHLLFFSLCFFVPVILLFLGLYYGFKSINSIRQYTDYLLMSLILIFLFVFLRYTFFNSPKRTIVLAIGIFILGFLFWKKPKLNYKKLIVFLVFFSSISAFKVLVHIFEDVKPDYWLKQKDDILDVKFKSFPNIYIIQPDGFVAQETLEKAPYSFKSDLYNWLEQDNFTVYNNFRSNYPASLTSNASLFGMKQHKFAGMLFPEIEMANAREAITTSNAAISILKNNGYATHFIAEDEYFQQNRKQKNFDHFNIKKDDFPFLTDGGQTIKDVFVDLKQAMEKNNTKPSFYFVEKLLPHHVGFYQTEESVKDEREKYNKRIIESGQWLKKVIHYITHKDETGIIIILADHGGWVGLKSFNDLHSNDNPVLINSIFSNIAAIKWNGNLEPNFDENLKTNVNLFRVLFSVLSKDPKYLEYLEDDSSYNLRLNSFGFKSVKKQIDSNGNIL